ncbi:MAG: hydantoinase B/oxoprolinase family protein [Chitinophagaceae bacterium]|nr:hydantoinase B/oxoprolinase family protein [Chitinophagaceae bacterium]
MKNKFTDPIDLSILWNRLISLVDEAASTLQQTAFSSVTRESADFAIVLMDSKGQSMVQSSISVPSFLGVLPFLVKSLIKNYFPQEVLKPGDVLITNDPWLCAGHKPDIGIVTPIFHPNQTHIIGYIGCIAHSPDIGGTLWGAGARDFYEEGLYIPPLKLIESGKLNDTVIKIIEGNVRAPYQTLGDIMAQVAANNQGIQSLMQLVNEYGLEDLDGLSDQIIQATENAMRQAIRNAPDGVYKSRYEADGDAENHPVTIECTVTINGDSIHVDYTGSSPQHPLAINAVMNYVFAYTAYPIKCIFNPEIPNNEGAFRPVTVYAPEGCILNAKKPAPLGARNVIGNLLHAPVMLALSQAVPEKVQADCGAPVWVMPLSGTKDDGTEFVEYLFLAGGYGGRNGLPGPPTLCFPTNVANVPVEVFEHDAPVLVLEKKLIPGSGGSGKFPGGDGQRFSYKNISKRPLQISNVTEKIKTQAYGLFGGEHGRKGDIFVITKDGKRRYTPPKGIDYLQPDEILVMELPGGGGYGKAE